MNWIDIVWAGVFMLFTLATLKECFFDEEKDIIWGLVMFVYLITASVMINHHFTLFELPLAPYLLVGSAIIVIMIQVYQFYLEFDHIYDDESEESDDEDDKVNQKPLFHFSQSVSATEQAQDGTISINLDQYKAVHDPSEVGAAIGQLFSPKSELTEVSEAINTLKEVDEHEQEDDETLEPGSIFALLGVAVVFLIKAPIVYIAYLHLAQLYVV